jgi:hypothetical protein
MKPAPIKEEKVTRCGSPVFVEEISMICGKTRYFVVVFPVVLRKIYGPRIFNRHILARTIIFL